MFVNINDNHIHILSIRWNTICMCRIFEAERVIRLSTSMKYLLFFKDRVNIYDMYSHFLLHCLFKRQRNYAHIIFYIENFLYNHK